MSAANDKAIDPALFRETLGHYPTGVAVVTAVTDDGDPVGMGTWLMEIPLAQTRSSMFAKVMRVASPLAAA